MRREHFLFIILVVSHALSETCVKYAFESDLEGSFMKPWFCETMSHVPWEIDTYESIGMPSPDEKGSTTFVSPAETLSCASSFMFPMTNGGRLEVLIYMDSDIGTDQITVLANQYVENGADTTLGTSWNSPQSDDFVRGWHTLVVPLTSSGTSLCYVSIMGMAHKDSIVLVDSFRYIPPDMDESLCPFYDDIPEPVEPPTTTTTEKTTITTEKTTSTTTTTTTEPTITDPITTTDPSTKPDPTTVPTTTENPDISPVQVPKGFWNPLTISMAAVLLLIVSALICYLFYECGRRRAKPIVIIDDLNYEDLPSAFKVPRVKNVITEPKIALP